jgi:hypothetical protein
MDLDRLSNGGHVSRDHPFRETRSREIEIPVDKRSGLSIMDIPGWIWTVHLMEATCQEISHFGKSRNRGIGIPVDKRSGFSMVKTPG